MDRTLFEQECGEVFEETFKDFPFEHVFFHKLDRDKSGSVVKIWQELPTEFPIDKTCVTFEFLDREIYSVQVMSVNTVNEYTYDIPMDDIRKKNIKIFKAQGKPTNLHVFKTNITGKKMPNCSGCPVHWVNFDGTWCDIDPHVIHTVKFSKTRVLLTGVESVDRDFIDSEGNLVSVDDDFSRTAEMYDRPCETDP